MPEERDTEPDEERDDELEDERDTVLEDERDDEDDLEFPRDCAYESD